MDDVLTLYATANVKNDYGVDVEQMTGKFVFCTVNSVTQSEFFGGGRNGLNPDYKFTVFAGDYNNEPVVEYKGQTYAVYRSYLVPGTDYIELYVERQGGRNGKAKNNQTNRP